MPNPRTLRDVPDSMLPPLQQEKSKKLHSALRKARASIAYRRFFTPAACLTRNEAKQRRKAEREAKRNAATAQPPTANAQKKKTPKSERKKQNRMNRKALNALAGAASQMWNVVVGVPAVTQWWPPPGPRHT